MIDFVDCKHLYLHKGYKQIVDLQTYTVVEYEITDCTYRDNMFSLQSHLDDQARGPNFL